jgi:hypothetical protein
MDQAELLQDLALKLDLANMELTTIDEVLARRPALDRLKHRTEKIERACAANGEMLKMLEDLRTHLVGLAAYLETCAAEVVLDNLPGTIKHLQLKTALIEDLLLKVK